MPARVIDTAYVEIVPDFSEVTRGQREIARQLESVARVADDVTDDIDESFTELRREMTWEIDQATGEIRASLRDVADTAERAATEIAQDMQRGGERAEDSFEELSRVARREFDQIDRAATASAVGVSAKFKGAALAAGAAIAGASAALVAGLGAVAGFGLVQAAQLEQTRISFNALVGSAEEGLRVFTEIQQFAALTPFEFPEVADAAKRFLAFNQTVGLSDDFLKEFLTVVGDLASVTGAGADGMNRIVLAISQIASKGKVSLEELMQIGEAVPGFSAIAAIAESMGITTAAAMEAISKGEVSAVEGINALLEGMRQFPGAAGAMEKQSQTLLGVFSTFKDVLSQTLASAFEPVIPAIKDSLTEVTPILKDALTEIAPALGSVVASLLPTLGNVIMALTPVLTPLIDALGPAMEEIAPSLIPLGEALGEIVTALSPILPLLASFTVAILELATPLIQLLVPVVELLTPLFEFLADAVGEFAAFLQSIDWSDVAGEIGGAFTEAWDGIKTFFTDVDESLKRLLSGFIAGTRRLKDTVVNGIKDMGRRALTAMRNALDVIVAPFTLLPGQIGDFVGAIPDIVVGHFEDMGERVLNVVDSFIDDTLSAIGNLGPRVIDAATEANTTIINFFTTMWETAKQRTREALDNIIQWVKDIPANLRSFATDVGTQIADWLKDQVNKAIAKFNDAIHILNRGLVFVSPLAAAAGGLPTIPMLAHGGISFGPAIIGENPGTTPEAALPLGDPRAMSMIRDALGRGTTFEAGSINIIVQVSGDVSRTQAARIGRDIADSFRSRIAERDITTAVRTA